MVTSKIRWKHKQDLEYYAQVHIWRSGSRLNAPYMTDALLSFHLGGKNTREWFIYLKLVKHKNKFWIKNLLRLLKWFNRCHFLNGLEQFACVTLFKLEHTVSNSGSRAYSQFRTVKRVAKDVWLKSAIFAYKNSHWSWQSPEEHHN